MNSTVIKILTFYLFLAFNNPIFVQASVNPEKTILSERKSRAKNLLNNILRTKPELINRLEVIYNKIKENEFDDKCQEFFSFLIEKCKQYPILMDVLAKNRDEIFQGDKNALNETLNDLNQYLDTRTEIKEILKDLYSEMKKHSEKNKKYVEYIHNIIKMGDEIVIKGEEIESYKEFKGKIKNDDRIAKQIIDIVYEIENTATTNESFVKRIMEMFINIAELYFYTYNDEEKQLKSKQVYATSSETLKLHFNIMKTIFITIGAAIDLKPESNDFLKNIVDTCQEVIRQINNFNHQENNDLNQIINMKMLTSFSKVLIVYFDIASVTFPYFDIEQLKREYGYDKITPENTASIIKMYQSLANADILLLVSDGWVYIKDVLETLSKKIDIDAYTEEKFINEISGYLKNFIQKMIGLELFC